MEGSTLSKRDMKATQLEKDLSRIGATVSLASDELIQAEKRVQAASHKLVQIQQEIDQLYTTLKEPLLLVDKNT